jgi:hypothetical protein
MSWLVSGRCALLLARQEIVYPALRLISVSQNSQGIFGLLSPEGVEELSFYGRQNAY